MSIVIVWHRKRKKYATAYNSPVGRVVKQNEVAKHRREAEKPKASNEDNDGILEVKLWSLAVDHHQEFKAVRFNQGSTVFLVVLSMTKVPTEIIQNSVLEKIQCPSCYSVFC